VDPIRSSYQDDPDMMEIVREFVSELPERAVALEECVESGDLAKLQTLAHQLKGAGGGYGFPQITEAAARLESDVKGGAEAGAIKDSLGLLIEVLGAASVSEEN
jgi:HPt (histidine-containing phosphotransfer) domain-containing protein